MNGPNGMMTVGEAAKTVGVAASTLRYYERQGLITPSDRTRSAYRLYDQEAVERLAFIRAAQGVGFTLDDIRTLLELDADAPCEEVQALLQRRLTEVDAKLTNLKRVRATLSDALDRCRKSRKGCAVVADLKKKRDERRTKCCEIPKRSR
jgi:MerR family mercuric resistance operon transcriptional regulator